MSPDDLPSDAVEERADLLPEERAAGSADPQAQAEEILAESVDRTEQPDPDASTHPDAGAAPTPPDRRHPQRRTTLGPRCPDRRTTPAVRGSVASPSRRRPTFGTS